MADTIETAAIPEKKEKKKSKGKKAVLILLLVLLFLCLAAVGTFFALDYSGRKGLESSQLPVMEPRAADEQANYELIDEKTVKYNGKVYVFNENRKNILFMGIDSNDEVSESGKTAKHQADVIVLCSIDEKTNKVRLINISRETMADIQMYTESGEYVGMQKQQIALAYSYLDGAEKSSKNTAQAVSDLFYGIPIHAYCTLFMSAVIPINDAVGGVDVVVPVDMQNENWRFVKGESVHLEGKMALRFLKSRSSLADATNDARMERHRVYIKSFIPTAIEATKKDITLPLKLYNTLSNYIVTDISPDKIVYFTRQALKLNIDYDMISLPGESVKGELFMEKHLDERAFYELVLDIFYTVQEPEQPAGSTAEQTTAAN